MNFNLGKIAGEAFEAGKERVKTRVAEISDAKAAFGKKWDEALATRRQEEIQDIQAHGLSDPKNADNVAALGEYDPNLVRDYVGQMNLSGGTEVFPKETQLALNRAAHKGHHDQYKRAGESPHLFDGTEEVDAEVRGTFAQINQMSAAAADNFQKATAQIETGEVPGAYIAGLPRAQHLALFNQFENQGGTANEWLSKNPESTCFSAEEMIAFADSLVDELKAGADIYATAHILFEREGLIRNPSFPYEGVARIVDYLTATQTMDFNKPSDIGYKLYNNISLRAELTPSLKTIVADLEDIRDYQAETKT